MSVLVCGPIVRRTAATSACIWLELANDCVVQARAEISQPSRRAATRSKTIFSDIQYTVSVGSRFYVLLTFSGLQPATVYRYGIVTKVTDGRRDPADKNYLNAPNVAGLEGTARSIDLSRVGLNRGLPEFRTLPIAGKEETRIAFGSCRKAEGGYRGRPDPDILKLFGRALRKHYSARLTRWPQLLLLLGDQIYTDDVDLKVANQQRLKQRPLPTLSKPARLLPSKPAPAGTEAAHCSEYEDFAASYVHGWSDSDVATVLANVPTFMIFDDHEVTDDWNITGGWVEQALQSRVWTRAITDALIAYWMYQGWGNPLPATGVNDPRISILRSGAQSADDVLVDLRSAIKASPGAHDYYYRIDSTPPIIVLDTRHDRNFAAPVTLEWTDSQNVTHATELHAYYTDEIMSERQWAWLDKQITRDGPVIIATGVPLLQFPFADIGFLQATRPDGGFVLQTEASTQRRADEREALRREHDTDSWTTFPTSFLQLTKVLAKAGPYIMLAGDVHYSYVNYGRLTFPANSPFPRNPLLLHAVSSPIRNQWSAEALKRNLPKRSLLLEEPSPTGLVQLRQDIERDARAGKPYEPTKRSLSTLRLFYPDPQPAFGPHKQDWTHLNNIGQLQLMPDQKTVKVSWLGASNDRNIPLAVIGSFSTPGGAFRK
jgi:phosphodiesterase/alkaline phosphatase D-like protein